MAHPGKQTRMLSRREPYIQMVDVTADAALIAWGYFDLVDDERGWRAATTSETIGARSEPVGRVAVEVLDAAGEKVVSRATTEDVNHVWLGDLSPATTYQYRVWVDGELWGRGPRYDWSAGGLQPAARELDLTLRTHPRSDQPDPITFLAVGDFGVGIADGQNGAHQLDVARTMQRLADAYDVRFVMGLGDTIYHGGKGPDDHSGAHDADWWMAFFQPYRYLFDHLPIYPTAGNHDGADEEQSDDRAQLEDNLYLKARFGPREEAGRASLGPGLFYRLQLGTLLELLCVDTTWGAERGQHWFNEDQHRTWLRASLDDNGALWRIPFCHHPAWCAGPHHPGMMEQVRDLVPLYQAAGVRLLLHGHEHNFQHGEVDGLAYVIGGAGGKVQADPPSAFEEAATISWAAEPHCLLVQVTETEIVVVPYGATPFGAAPTPLVRLSPDGSVVEGPIRISRTP